MAAGGLQFFEGIVTGSHFSEDSVLVVQPGSRNKGQEELTAVGSRTGLSYREQSLGGVFDA